MQLPSTIVDHRKKPKSLPQSWNASGVKALAVQADVQSDAQVRGMIEQIRGQFGRLDILVNNAGVTHWVNLGDLDGLTDKIWDEIIDVNVKGPFAVPALRRRCWPSIKG